ncbi:DNA-dependent metalloprotease WSS1 isoform X2 [Punica granatum]|uniref:DNA-dependent metalloprotease WSS1 isoform X2 n=1 Tax=Punica granatum TaxID=22663 RepID=A0A6P8EI40_PUNGR|nr:DNA-dependent metalloprotease WSS1 isoform X2 [Punica granatum]
MNSVGDLNKVWEIKALKKPGEDEARKMLERIAKQVQPIMRNRKWRVKLLSEFCPKNGRLLGLNVNHGVNVKLRLRRPNREYEFYPYEQVLDTMLHELCHIIRGPHDATFYKLWDELRKECEQLISHGMSGSSEGFVLPGRRLGGLSRQPPLSALRRTAAAAAEKRVVLGSLLPSGPRRLGGDNNIMSALSPVQAAAMAAERRLQDNIWCGSGSCQEPEVIENSSDVLQDVQNVTESQGSPRDIGPSRQIADLVSRKRLHEPDAKLTVQSSKRKQLSNLVDLTQGASTSSPTIDCPSKFQNRRAESDNVLPAWSEDNSAAPASSTASQSSKDNPQELHQWECAVCTLLNPVSISESDYVRQNFTRYLKYFEM